MTAKGSRRQTMSSLLFYAVWAAAFWIIGAVLLLTGIIPSGAPVKLLYVLACGALVHAASVYEFGGHMTDSQRYSAFLEALTGSWRCAVWRGVVAGFCDITLTAGLFIAYPLLPDIGGRWAIAIMIVILVLPPYPVHLAVVYWFTRTKGRIQSDTRA